MWLTSFFIGKRERPRVGETRRVSNREIDSPYFSSESRRAPPVDDIVSTIVLPLNMSRMLCGRQIDRVCQLQKKSGRQSQCPRGLCLSPLAVRISPGPPKTRQTSTSRQALQTRTPIPGQDWYQIRGPSSKVLEPFLGQNPRRVHSSSNP